MEEINRSSSNYLFKGLVCVITVSVLIQSNDVRKKSEELGNLKQTVSSLQADINRKDTELQERTQKQSEDLNLENENSLMKKEIKELEKTTEEISSYMKNGEEKLSRLSEDIIKEKSNKIIGYIKEQDIKKIAKNVHPKNGLRLSSSTEIKTDIDTVVAKKSTIFSTNI